MSAQQLAANKMFKSNSERLQQHADAQRDRGSQDRIQPDLSRAEPHNLQAKDYGGLRRQTAEEAVRRIDPTPAEGKLTFLRDSPGKEQDRTAQRAIGTESRSQPERSNTEPERLRTKDYVGLRRETAKEISPQGEPTPAEGKLSFTRDRSDKEQDRTAQQPKEGQLSFSHRSPGRDLSHDR